MKNVFIFILILTALPACAFVPTDASIIQVHDMQMINQQRFRMEELNDYNDVQQEKARYQKKHEQPKTIMERVFNRNSKFVEDNGNIKIEYENK